MARGLDAVAHHAALAAGRRLDRRAGLRTRRRVPESNRRLYNLMSRDGLLLTERPG
jgi:predicted Rossmann fold nucleotide-binding protein DprA/Smf involved in DNA uptake